MSTRQLLYTNVPTPGTIVGVAIAVVLVREDVVVEIIVVLVEETVVVVVAVVLVEEDVVVLNFVDETVTGGLVTELLVVVEIDEVSGFTQLLAPQVWLLEHQNPSVYRSPQHWYWSAERQSGSLLYGSNSLELSADWIDGRRLIGHTSRRFGLRDLCSLLKALPCYQGCILAQEHSNSRCFHCYHIQILPHTGSCSCSRR